MMRSLEECRQQLDEVDRDIVRLFEQRMMVARDVARYKIAHDLPVLDQSREEMVLASRVSMLKDGHFAGSVRTLYECIMALSRQEQERLLLEEGKDA